MEEAITTAPAVVEQAEAVMEAVASGDVDSSMFQDLLRAIVSYLPTVLVAVIIYFIGMILTKIIMKIIDKAMGRSRLEATAQGFLKSLTKIILTAFTVIIALTILGIPMTSIVTAVGAAGLAIGLALQSSLSNVAGGFLILFTNPFSKGDLINTNGIEGVVNNISILNTTLKTLDNKVIYIPNGTVSNSTIINYSREEKRRVDLTFSISYESDFKKAISLILNAAENHPKILKEDAPFARVVSLGASSVDIVVRVWTKNSDYWDVYFDLTEQIKTIFTENDIEIPYSKLDVNIKNN
ncbi:MAG: mechanosensitive ion channel family protein [Huintestinicola sp.]